MFEQVLRERSTYEQPSQASYVPQRPFLME